MNEVINVLGTGILISPDLPVERPFRQTWGGYEKDNIFYLFHKQYTTTYKFLKKVDRYNKKINYQLVMPDGNVIVFGDDSEGIKEMSKFIDAIL